MFRRSRFSVRPNVGATGRTSAPKETTSLNPEGGESTCLVADRTSPVTDGVSVVAQPENSLTLGDGNDPPGEVVCSSASVQRRKRFSVKPKVAPCATIRPTKAHGDTAAAALPQDSSTNLVSEKHTGRSTLKQTCQSPREQRVSEDCMQLSAQAENVLINDADKSTVDAKTVENPQKEIFPRLPDKPPLSIPDRETNELSQRAKALMSKPLKLPVLQKCSLSRLLNDPSDIQKIEKTQKLRELLRQEMQKERNKHRRPKYRVKEFSLDPAKMTMRDLLHYFPTSNPMSSSVEETSLENETVLPNSPERAVSLERAKETDAKSVCHDEDEEEAAGEEEEDDAVMVPRVKVAEDGSLIIDEESLTVEVQRAKGPNLTEDKDPIFERGSTTTYSSFRKGTQTKPWSREETDMFYLAISMVGTDFSMICQLFTHRARAEIKNKFKKEERINAWRIDKAFRERRKLDLEYFTKLLEKVLEVQNNKKMKSGRKSAAGKRDKKTKGKTVHILSDMEEEGNGIEDLVNDEEAEEEEGEKENEDLGNDSSTQVSLQNGKRKRKSKKGPDQDNNGKRNRVEKTDKMLTPEDTEATLLQEHATFVQSGDDEGKMAPRSCSVEPAKLSRGRNPKPLPLGKKWSTKLPMTSELGQNDETTTASEVQEEKKGSPKRRADETRTQEADSSDEESIVKPSKPTRSGRLPKPIKLLSYKSNKGSSSGNNQSSQTRTTPKPGKKHERESNVQSLPPPKKSKLVTLTASLLDYSDDEDETLRDDEEEDERLMKQGIELSPDKESSAPAFVPVCLRSARVSEEVETIEELDILASIPNVLDMSHENETGTTEPEHQLDLLLDVIDLLSSGAPGVSDESCNEAAQTLLTISNSTNISLLNETITQDLAQAQVDEKSDGIVERMSGEEESAAAPFLCVDHISTERSIELLSTITPTSTNALAQSDIALNRGSTAQTQLGPVQNSSQPARGARVSKVKPKPKLNQTSRLVPSQSLPSSTEEGQETMEKESKFSAEASGLVIIEDQSTIPVDVHRQDYSGLHSKLHLVEPIASSSDNSEHSHKELNKPLESVATEECISTVCADLASTKPKNSHGNPSGSAHTEVHPSMRKDEENQLITKKEVSFSDAVEFRAALEQDVSPENMGQISHEHTEIHLCDITPSNDTDQKSNKLISDVDSLPNASLSVVSGAPQCQTTPNKRERLPKVKPKPNFSQAFRTAPSKTRSSSTNGEYQTPSTVNAGETEKTLRQSHNLAERQGPNPSCTKLHATSDAIATSTLCVSGCTFADVSMELPVGEMASKTELPKPLSSTEVVQGREIQLSIERKARCKPSVASNPAQALKTAAPKTQSASTAEEKQPLSNLLVGEIDHALTERSFESRNINSTQTKMLGASNSTSSATPVGEIVSKTELLSSQSSTELVQSQETLLSKQAKNCQKTSETNLVKTLEHTTFSLLEISDHASKTSDEKSSEGKSNPEITENGSPQSSGAPLSRVKPKPNLSRAAKMTTARAQASAAERNQSQESLSTSLAGEIVPMLTQSQASLVSKDVHPSQPEALTTSDPSTEVASKTGDEKSSEGKSNITEDRSSRPSGGRLSRVKPKPNLSCAAKTTRAQASTAKVNQPQESLSTSLAGVIGPMLKQSHPPVESQNLDPAQPEALTTSDTSTEVVSKTCDEKGIEGKANPEITEDRSSHPRGGRFSRVEAIPNLGQASRTGPANSRSPKASNEEPPFISHAAEHNVESLKKDCAEKSIQSISENETPALKPATSDPSGYVERSKDIQTHQKEPDNSASVYLAPQLLEKTGISHHYSEPIRKRFSRLKPKPNLKRPSKLAHPNIPSTSHPEGSIPAMVPGVEQAIGDNGGTSTSSGLSSQADPLQKLSTITTESTHPNRKKLNVQPNVTQTFCTKPQSKEESNVVLEPPLLSQPKRLELEKSCPLSMFPSSSTQVLPEELYLSEMKGDTGCSSTSLDLFDWPQHASESPACTEMTSHPTRKSHVDDFSDVTPTTAKEKTDTLVCAHSTSHHTPVQAPKPDLSLKHTSARQHCKPCDDTMSTSSPGSAATVIPQSNSHERCITRAKPNFGPSALARKPKLQGKVANRASVSPASELQSAECSENYTQVLTEKPSRPSCTNIREHFQSKEGLQMSSNPAPNSNHDGPSGLDVSQTLLGACVELKHSPAFSSCSDLEVAQTEKVSSYPEPGVQPNTQVAANTTATKMADIAALQSLFPDTLSVPLDPDEPFFVLSLTAVPTCPSGEVEVSGAVSYPPTADASQQRSGVSLPVYGDVSFMNVPVDTEQTPISAPPLHQEQADGPTLRSEKPVHPLEVVRQEVDADPVKTRMRAQGPEVKPQTKQKGGARRRTVHQGSWQTGPSSQFQSVDTKEGNKQEMDVEGASTDTLLREYKADRSFISSPKECPIPDNQASACSKLTVTPVIEKQQVASVPAMSCVSISQPDATSVVQKGKGTRTELCVSAEASFDDTTDEATTVCHYFLSDIFTEVEDA